MLRVLLFLKPINKIFRTIDAFSNACETLDTSFHALFSTISYYMFFLRGPPIIESDQQSF